jgi:hypothetical protein
MSEHRNGRTAVERTTTLIHDASRKPGAVSMTRAEAKVKAVAAAIRHDRTNGHKRRR